MDLFEEKEICWSDSFRSVQIYTQFIFRNLWNQMFRNCKNNVNRYDFGSDQKCVVTEPVALLS